MSKANWIAIFFILIIATGCSSNKPKEAATAKSAPVAAMPVPAPALSPVRVVQITEKPHIFPARDFCVTGQDCKLGYTAYGYIVFTKRPTSARTKNRYVSICKAFIGNFEPANTFFKSTPTSRIATTFWLLTSKPKDERSCNELIERYDYTRATQIATSIHRLNSAGPLLVAWTQEPVPQDSGNKPLLIDLGRFTNNDLDSAFRIWRDKISQDQKFWELGFNMNLVLTEFRSFIGKYGEMIIQVVKPG